MKAIVPLKVQASRNVQLTVTTNLRFLYILIYFYLKSNLSVLLI